MKYVQWFLMVIVLASAYFSGYLIESMPGQYWFHAQLQATFVAACAFLVISLIFRTTLPIILACFELTAFAILLFAYVYYSGLADNSFWYNHLETIIEGIALMQIIALIMGFPNGFSRAFKRLWDGHIIRKSINLAGFMDTSKVKECRTK